MNLRLSWIAALGLAVVASPAGAAPSAARRFAYDIEEEWKPGFLETRFEERIHGGQTDLGDAGVRFSLSYWGDFLANPIGGNSQQASWMQLLVAGAEVDLDKFLGWRGGALVVSITDAAGSNLSQPVGNVFTISQARVMNTFALYDLALKQRAFDDRLEITVGRFSAGQYFATLPAMGLVVSGAVNGNPTSLFLNAPYYATAAASWAAHVKGKPTDETYLEAGVFQASPRVGNPAYHGADFSIRPGDGVLVMAEMGWTPDFGPPDGPGDGKETKNSTPSVQELGSADHPTNGLKGLYSVGAYYAHYSFDTFSGGTARDAFGFYALAQQMVWRSGRNPLHHVTLWGGLTWSPQENLAQMPVMGFGGAVWQGPVAGRDRDSLLGSFYLGNFSGDYARAQVEAGFGRPTLETVLEISYIVQVTEHLQLQPDIQWILQPGGTGGIPNALVVGFQVGVTF